MVGSWDGATRTARRLILGQEGEVSEAMRISMITIRIEKKAKGWSVTITFGPF